MSNKFCRNLSNGYKIDLKWDNTLLWSPCCYYTKKTSLSDKEAFEKELTYASSATGWLPECRVCQQMESSNAGEMLSPRLASFRRVPPELDVGVCGHLELSFDSKCNAACLSCGSFNSDTWKKYEYKHGIRDIGPIINRADMLADQIIETIPLDQMGELYILGGEPFYSDSGNKILRHLRTTHPDISKVVLRYQTNGSMVPNEETKALWDGFRSVELSLSLDGIGERFEYLRWPLRWSQVEKTVASLVETTDAVLSINATISPLNVLYFQELNDWANATLPADRIKWPGIPVRPNRCFGTLDLNKTPIKMRAQIREMYDVDSPLVKIFNNLEVDIERQKMFEYINLHDRLRSLDWKKTFPDVVKYYE